MTRIVYWIGVLGLVSAPWHVAPVQAGDVWPRVVQSADGVPISYEVHGEGEPALVFIHGWSCDGRYWRNQVAHFANEHRVLVVDLAGHGHSGLGRQDYTMAAFGEDVRAMVEAEGVSEMILIGHSMGGPVSVATALLMPDSVKGIVGVDTFQDVGGDMGAEEFEALIGPLRENFRSGVAAFVQRMFGDETDASLREWVVADMSAAPPSVALSALEEMFKDVIEREARTAFAELEVPVVAINADIWPTNVEGNRRVMPHFEAVIIEGTDHFLHMAVPEVFNGELSRVVAYLIDAGQWPVGSSAGERGLIGRLP